MTVEAVAVSLRVAEIRLEDIVPQVGSAGHIEVVVVDASGAVQHVILTFTKKWAATGWQRAFECSRCTGPARLLHVVEGMGLCRRCNPLLTKHQRYKNSGSWTNSEKILDVLTRSVLKTLTRPNRGKHRRLAARLVRNTLAGADAVLTQAHALVGAADTVIGSMMALDERTSHPNAVHLKPVENEHGQDQACH